MKDGDDVVNRAVCGDSEDIGPEVVITGIISGEGTDPRLNFCTTELQFVSI
jgi:hypothetical protein